LVVGGQPSGSGNTPAGYGVSTLREVPLLVNNRRPFAITNFQWEMREKLLAMIGLDANGHSLPVFWWNMN
jgi:hypothetical protein